MSQFSNDVAQCTETMRVGSKSFFAASRLLPKRVRDPAIALYAFCRLTDDIADAVDAKPDAITELYGRLERIYQGEPDRQAADRALAEVVRYYDIPQELLQALIEGYEWDSQHRQYVTLEALLDYCARVAGSVGAMMCLMMGKRDPATLARACDLGLAMQLTNIARDIGEDAMNGRLYLPRSWLVEEGIDPDQWLKNPHFNPAIARVVERLLKQADALYEQAEIGITDLPWDCRPAIQAARLIYAEIGRQIEQNQLNSIAVRAIVSSQKKIHLLSRAMLVTAKRNWSKRLIPAHQSIQYLIEAVIKVPHQPHYGGSIHARLVWVVNLLERVEMRRREQAKMPVEPQKIAA